MASSATHMDPMTANNEQTDLMHLKTTWSVLYCHLYYILWLIYGLSIKACAMLCCTLENDLGLDADFAVQVDDCLSVLHIKHTAMNTAAYREDKTP